MTLEYQPHAVGGHPHRNCMCWTPRLRHPRGSGIRAVSFVGGNGAGRHIYQRCAANAKRAQCNMGAKNHAIVLPDADVESVTNQLVGASLGAAGQRCMAISVRAPAGKGPAGTSSLGLRVVWGVVEGGP